MAYVNFKSGTLDQITSISGKPTNLLSISTDIPSIFKGDLNITNRVIDASVNNKILAIRKIDASGNYDSDYINFDFASPYTSGNGILVDNEQGTISLDPNFELFEITSTLPSSNIKKNKIYLVPKQDDSSVANNIYTEYHYLGSGTWEIMGDRQTDIANSLKVAALPTYVSPVPDVSIGDSYDTAFAKLQAKKQNVLISGTNIKTINGSTLLSSGNIDAEDVVLGHIVSASGPIDAPKFYRFAGTYSVKETDVIASPDYESTEEILASDKLYVDIATKKAYWYDTNPNLLAKNRFQEVIQPDLSSYYTKTEIDNAGYITSETSLSKGATSGNGNAVTDISVSGHEITLTKGSTFITSSDIASYADGAEYDSTNHLIYLKHGNTRLSNPINAADFIKDGMVSTVTVDTPSTGINTGVTCLIVTFNTDAGASPIELPISQIFNANNYYTKTEIDNAGYLTSYTETDPIFSASAAAGIQSSDISNWNSKTDNVGTITGITMNGSSKGTSGVVNLGTVITSETQLSKGTTTGSGNAVTDITVSNHKITLTKGSTFLTAHQDIKTINNNTLVGTGNVTINELPSVTSSDNGKVLQVVNGVWTLVSPVALYSGSGTPNNAQGNNGDIYLQI